MASKSWVDGEEDWNISPYTHHPHEQRRMRTLAEMCASSVLLKAGFPEGWCLRSINSYQLEEYIDKLCLDKKVVKNDRERA